MNLGSIFSTNWIDALVTKLNPFITTKIQTKTLASDATASSTLFTWNSLVVGKIYEITVQVHADIGLNSTMDGLIKHNGVTEGRATMVERTTATVFTFFGKATFVATATTATVEWIEGGAVNVFGDGTKDETYSTIKELSNHEVTTDFT